MIMEKRWENNLKSDDATFFGTVSVAKNTLKNRPARNACSTYTSIVQHS